MTGEKYDPRHALLCAADSAYGVELFLGEGDIVKAVYYWVEIKEILKSTGDEQVRRVFEEVKEKHGQFVYSTLFNNCYPILLGAETIKKERPLSSKEQTKIYKEAKKKVEKILFD